MFVYYFANAAGPCCDVVDAIKLYDIALWAEESYQNGELLRERLLGGDFHAADISFELAEAVHKNHVSMPVKWTATGAAGLFTSLEGDLIIAPIGADRCQISFRGSYRMPSDVDKGLFHRLVEACVKGLIDRIVDTLSRQVVGVDLVV